MRRMAVIAVAVGLLLCMAGPATAKGPGFEPPVSGNATVSGPGLRGPIIMPWNGRCGLDGTPSCDLSGPEDPFLAMATAAGVIGAVPSYVRSYYEPPSKATRGPAYAVVFNVAGQDRTWRVTATLYPYAPNRPWMYLGAGQTSWDRPIPPGWMPASRSILTLLRSKGLPATAPNTAGAAAASGAGSTGGASWPMVALVAGGVLALLAAAGLVTRRQHAPLPPA